MPSYQYLKSVLCEDYDLVYLSIEYLIQLAIVGIDVAPKYLIKSAVYFITYHEMRDKT